MIIIVHSLEFKTLLQNVCGLLDKAILYSLYLVKKQPQLSWKRWNHCSSSWYSFSRFNHMYSNIFYVQNKV